MDFQEYHIHGAWHRYARYDRRNFFDWSRDRALHTIDQYGVIGLARRYSAAYKANIAAGMSEYDAYRNNPFEVAGFDMGVKILNDLQSQGGNLCGCEK